MTEPVSQGARHEGFKSERVVDLMITTSEKISLISAVAAVIQALVVTVTLIFIYRQTAALRRTADDLDRGARLNSYTNLRSNIHKINKLLLKHDSLAESLGFSERPSCFHHKELF